ncbi:NAD(P)/FAD-dependent oxidoreductase [Brevibacillus ruminantium]|uniref:NAD(P)/FAD-dependent oxidoreductase n=1 Tax=Brevibacillus ruminantium TaxID=2950604 RepID=A0ABY4W9F6_9BACL|nr:NAD(P)/FAD-dependent oxidoreductase [Brevibacillus ruminantium]USG63810.1 NAD(P)/FAD-dependent oxidoreductase [Brevibacillus ruminantium]
MQKTEVIVIGAGQAGLAMGYYLKQQGIPCLLLDNHGRVGEVWRNRYDSLVLFTPRNQNALPGLAFPGAPEGLPDKDEAANYLEQYASHFQLPIQLETEVHALLPAEKGFRLATSKGDFHAGQVVIATGPFQAPLIPAIWQQAGADVFQIHTAAYKNETQLQDGPVLVVGSGNSGVQLAAELAAGRNVFLSMGQKRVFLPNTFMGKSIFSYFQALGLLSAPNTTTVGKWLKSRPDPIFGYRREIRSWEKAGHLQIKGRTVGFSGNTALFSDGDHAKIANIVWATGFRPSYEWLQIPGVLDDRGLPTHQRGISPVRGLYFLGLPWQYRRSSALLGGVGKDAAFLLETIRKHS